MTNHEQLAEKAFLAHSHATKNMDITGHPHPESFEDLSPEQKKAWLMAVSAVPIEEREPAKVHEQTPAEKRLEQAARKAYAAHCLSNRNVDITGHPSAPWEELPAEQKNAWIRAAEVILANREKPADGGHVNTAAEQRREDAADKKREQDEDKDDKKAKAHGHK